MIVCYQNFIKTNVCLWFKFKRTESWRMIHYDIDRYDSGHYCFQRLNAHAYRNNLLNSLTGCYDHAKIQKHPRTELKRLFILLCRFRAQTAHSKIIFINDTIVLLAQYYEKRAWVRSYKFTVDKTEPPEKQMEKQIKTIAINVFFRAQNWFTVFSKEVTKIPFTWQQIFYCKLEQDASLSCAVNVFRQV